MGKEYGKIFSKDGKKVRYVYSNGKKSSKKLVSSWPKGTRKSKKARK
jgi:hypothetical protein